MGARKEIILHIGLDKTGTTAIQSFCAEARAELRAAGLVYPRSPEFGFHHLDFARLFGFSWGTPQRGVRLDRGIIAYAQQWDPAQHSVIFSSEHFSYYAGREPIAMLQAWLRRTFPAHAIRVILFLRNQVDWFFSLYSESTKWGVKSDIDSFYSTVRDRLDYSNIVEDWLSVFGQDALVLLDYDSHAHDATGGFLQAIDAPEAVRSLVGVLRPPFDNRSVAPALLETIRGTAFPAGREAVYDFIVARVGTAEYCARLGLPADWTWPIPAALLAAIDTLQSSNARICAAHGLRPLRMLELRRILAERPVCTTALPAAATDHARLCLLADFAEFMGVAT